MSELNRQHISVIHSDILTQYKDRRIKKDAKLHQGRKPKKKSGATANRIIEFVSSIYGWAISSGLYDKNPAKGIKKNPEFSRDRFLQPEKLKRLFNALLLESNTTVRDYVLLSLFTGARRSDMLSMRWDHICLKQKQWRIPRTKNGEPLTIPLSKDAMKILLDRKNKTHQYVFAGEGSTGHLVECRRVWNKILERAKITDFKIHDLRRTLGSWQAISGSSMLVIGKSLGHKLQEATAIYARLDLDPVRQSV